jgi:hypothetical protein
LEQTELFESHSNKSENRKKIKWLRGSNPPRAHGQQLGRRKSQCHSALEDGNPALGRGSGELAGGTSDEEKGAHKWYQHWGHAGSTPDRTKSTGADRGALTPEMGGKQGWRWRSLMSLVLRWLAVFCIETGSERNLRRS